MSGSLSCSDIPEEKIIRKSISYLQNLGSGKEPTLKEAISDVAEKLNCEAGKKGSKSYEQIKDALKKAMAVFFRHGPDSSEWAKFKAKYKKSEKESKKVKTSRRSKTSKPLSPTAKTKDLESLSNSKISSLAEMCQTNKTKSEIQKALSREEISKVDGQAVSKIKKAELCDTIEALAPSKKVLPPASSSRPTVDPKECDTRTWTVQKLKDHIKAMGWPAPPSKATKAKICAYVESMESKTQVQPPISPKQAAVLAGPSIKVPGALPEVPEGYEDCSNPRGTLTKPKIRQWVTEKGWNLEPNFPGFPSDKKDKGTWCSFLASLIAAHPLIPPKAAPVVVPTEEEISEEEIPIPTTPPKIKRAVSTCFHNSDWKTVEEVEKELVDCPPKQACNISTRECASEQALIDLQRPSLPITLKSGKTARIYAKNPEQLEKLRPSLQKFIKTPEAAIPPSPKAVPQVSAPSKPKPKVMFKPGHIVYGEEERKRQAESSAWLSQLIGESKEAPEQVPKEVTRPRPPSPTQKQPTPPKPARVEKEFPKPVIAPLPEQEIPITITEQPSEVSRLIKRLRDIRVEASEPPVRLRIAESQLSKAIGACVGIPS